MLGVFIITVANKQWHISGADDTKSKNKKNKREHKQFNALRHYVTPRVNSAVRPIKRTKAYTENDKEHFWFSISDACDVHGRNQCWNLIWGK